MLIRDSNASREFPLKKWMMHPWAQKIPIKFQVLPSFRLAEKKIDILALKHY